MHINSIFNQSKLDYDYIVFARSADKIHIQLKKHNIFELAGLSASKYSNSQGARLIALFIGLQSTLRKTILFH